MTDADGTRDADGTSDAVVTSYRGVRATAVLAFGGLALVAGVDVLALVVADRWRDDHGAVAVAFWILVAIGIVLAAGLVRAGVQIARQPTVLRLDATGYRIGRQSGATGVRQARWTDVERVRRDHRDGREYVVLDLHSGDATHLPVRAVAAPRAEVLAELDARLNRAHGQRRLT